MPHQNRVTPFGDIIATPERGLMYGNRGCLVNKDGRIARQFKEIRWIICVLDFKNRRHPMMAPGRYTGLFFLDKATALAAGHRPCAECQRERFNFFRGYWAAANPAKTRSEKPLAPLIDAVLHNERLDSRNFRDSIQDLPDGTLVTNDEVHAHLVLKKKLLCWTPGGYLKVQPTKFAFPARILIPSSVVRSLTDGYPVMIHQSAFAR